MKSARELVELARARLVVRHPFFGTLAALLLAEPRAFGTAATDGRRLLYRPAWVERLAAAEGVGAVEAVVAHEVLHCALGHLWRRGSRDRLKWGVAIDLEANALLREAGFALPSRAVYDPAFAGLAAEEIYARLPEPLPEPQPWGDHSPGDLPEEPSGEVWERWREMVAAALAACRPGDLPAGIEARLRAALAPRVSWRDLLARHLSPAGFDYTWPPPDPRFLHVGLYLPGFGGEAVEEAVVALDTSGSVTEGELSQFLAEVRALWAEDVMVLHVVDCDAATYAWRTFARGEPLPDFPVRGRGGTDFRPVFEEVCRRGIQPSCLVFLTDGEGRYPEEAPPYPVLWVLVPRGQGRPPWGTVVRMV
ncbi:MAG: VWA-like domain-containing protein [Bacillota bacterium]